MDRTLPPRRTVLTAVALLVVVNVLWGISFPLTKTINLEVDQHFGVSSDDSSMALRLAAAAWLIMTRFVTALVIFSFSFRHIVRRAGVAEWLAGTRIGILFFIGLIFQIIGMATIPASRSGFLTSLVAVFTPLLTAILLCVRPRLSVICGVGVALLGVSVLTGLIVWTGHSFGFAPDAWQAWTFGDTLTTIGAVFFAGQIMLVDHYGKRLDGAALTPGMFASTAIFAAVTFMAVNPLAPEALSASWLTLALEPKYWSLIIILSVFSSVLAFNLMNTYQHYISASQAGVIYTLEPVFASAAAMILPGLISLSFGIEYANERIVMPMLLGGGLIIIANLISLWPASDADKS
jgi:drug/metabolite transporter (DMT)-like permease